MELCVSPDTHLLLGSTTSEVLSLYSYKHCFNNMTFEVINTVNAGIR
jgi:hypothetical protein